MDSEEYAALVKLKDDALAAVAAHAEKTGHDPNSFLLSSEERALFRCTDCGALLFDGGEWSPDA